MIPIGAFLAGALLSLLLPVALLCVLSVWYWLFSARVHETKQTTKRESVPGPAAAQPGPSAAQPLPHDPGA